MAKPVIIIIGGDHDTAHIGELVENIMRSTGDKSQPSSKFSPEDDMGETPSIDLSELFSRAFSSGVMDGPPIVTPPTYEGGRGAAWSVDLDALVRSEDGEANNDVRTLAIWVLGKAEGGPRALLALMHLRPVEGFPQVGAICREGATHQLSLHWACPNHDLDEGIVGHERIHAAGAVYVGQILADDDAHAIAIAKDAAHDVCDDGGDLIVSDGENGSTTWERRFGDHCRKPEHRKH